MPSASVSRKAHGMIQRIGGLSRGRLRSTWANAGRASSPRPRGEIVSQRIGHMPVKNAERREAASGASTRRAHEREKAHSVTLPEELVSVGTAGALHIDVEAGRSNSERNALAAASNAAGTRFRLFSVRIANHCPA